MKRIPIRRPDYDDRLDCIRPACLPKNWYTLYQEKRFLDTHTMDSPLKELLLDESDNPYNKEFIESRFFSWDYDFLKDYVDYIQKYDGDKYFYFIPIVTDFWFGEMENIGFSGLEEDVKKDLRNKNCKLVLLATDEGFYGSYQDVYTPQNWDLDLIQKWCELEKLPTDSIIFISLNMVGQVHNVSKSLSYSILETSFMSEQHLSLRKDNNFVKSNFTELKKNTKLFLTYNNAIHSHRLGLLYYLNDTNLLDDGLCSFNLVESTGAFEHYLKIFKEMHSNLLDLKSFDKIIERLPIIIENDYDSKDYENLDFKGQISVREHYENSFLSVVSETLCKQGSVYFSEKTFKPIYECHPFLLLSSKGSLKRLKELGYQTFDRWWDESYDECDEYFDRIEKICNILLDLKSKSFDELYNMKMEMKDILVQNYENFIQRRNQSPNEIVDRLQHEYEKFVNNE